MYLDHGNPTPVVSGQSSPTGSIVNDPSLESRRLLRIDNRVGVVRPTPSSFTTMTGTLDLHRPVRRSPTAAGLSTPGNYSYVDSASITLTNSVKADNPIGIDFSGLTSGVVTINSNAPVILSGNVINPDGNTTITAQGSITNLADASLDSNNLTLKATGGSSTVQAVPTGAQQLWNNATGGSFTLSVNVGGQIETAGPLTFNATGTPAASGARRPPGRAGQS